MPYTVPVSFDKFLEKISVTPIQEDKSEARRKDIVATLKDHFEILDSFPTGSLAHGTAVRGYADLDVMVVLHYGKHIKGKKPSEVLKAVRDVLAKYKTDVRRNGQAVTLYYDTWPDVDIVPVSRSTNDDGTISHYNVPDMNTESWLRSKPRLHAKNLANRASVIGSEFLGVIQMAKWWNHQHSDYLESFHIEVMAYKSILTFGDYSWNVFKFFDEAATLITSALWYEGGQVDAYLSDDDRREAKKRLETARDKARSAWHLTYRTNKNHLAAIEKWRQIFGSEFPSYG
jgi:hypothetical protein